MLVERVIYRITMGVQSRVDMETKRDRRRRTDGRNSRSDKDTENERNNTVPGNEGVNEDRVQNGYESKSIRAKCQFCMFDKRTRKFVPPTNTMNRIVAGVKDCR